MVWLWLAMACATSHMDLGALRGRPVEAGGSAQVVVVRDELAYIEATYLLDVNGRGQGLIETREYRVVDVEPGPVRLEVKDQAARVVLFEAGPDQAYFFRVRSKPGLTYPVASVELLDAKAGLEAARGCRPAATTPDL